MIVREIANYSVVDATTNATTQRPIDYRLILAPLLYWRIELTERRLTLLEPQSGSLGAPDPNAFMVVVPPSYTAGQIFGIELLDTDWESEGFAVGDVLDMAMGGVITNTVLLRATIQGISGRTAMFVINAPYLIAGNLDTQNPFPLVAFLVNERFDIKAAFLRDGDSGFISPLNGQPFYISGHADSLIISSPTITNSTLRYNLRLYDAPREAIIDSYLPYARNLKSVYIRVDGTQFYAYRSSLNPTANTPTQAYPTMGKIVIDAEAPNEIRNLSFEAECLLLHPNRIEETNNFVTPGTLTITASGGSISAPSIPSPVKERICLLGQDSHHSLPSVFNSIDLTLEDAPPAVPPPRAGADYVGVVVGQVSGQWVAVMTNRVSSTQPVYNLEIVKSLRAPFRYDCIVLTTNEASARLTGVYTIIIYGKLNGTFVPLTTYDLNITGAVPTPLPDFPNGVEALGMLFPFDTELPSPYNIKVTNYDAVFTNGHPDLGTKSLFFVPLPSAAEPPPLGTLSRPASGYLLDLQPFLDTPTTIKVQLICPDGTLLESRPETINYTLGADVQLATVVQTGTNIDVSCSIIDVYNTNIEDFKLRVALFSWPAEHSPIDQAMYFARENYNLLTVIEQRAQQGSRIQIQRTPLTFYTYLARINTSGLPPGRYAIHVRGEWAFYSRRIYESFFYIFDVREPIEPSGSPLSQVRCRTETPAIRGETWPYVVIRDNAIEAREDSVNGCKLDDYCSCFTFVPQIPEDWIDIIGYFKGAIKGTPVPNNAIHKARFRGRIIRLDDEYITEDFVSSLYREEDIVRAYATRYQVEIFAHTPCDMTNLDILKLAERWEIINRSNRMLPDRIYNLRPAEVSISDSGDHAKVTITLKTLRWRDEYRRQG